jgi:hypothetical protein
MYLINQVSAETLTTGWMILSGTNCASVEVIDPVIVIKKHRLILSVYIIMSFDFPFVRLFGVR